MAAILLTVGWPFLALATSVVTAPSKTCLRVFETLAVIPSGDLDAVFRGEPVSLRLSAPHSAVLSGRQNQGIYEGIIDNVSVVVKRLELPSGSGIVATYKRQSQVAEIEMFKWLSEQG